jgi:endoglucanase
VPGVDALLWVKTVGASDGACRAGEPSAGTYSLAYALGLAERAGW